jgi:hypothetical protein
VCKGIGGREREGVEIEEKVGGRERREDVVRAYG